MTLAFSYIASSSQAYETLLFITNDAPFGRVMRGLHYYGASAMVLMVGHPHGAGLPRRLVQVPARDELADGRAAPRRSRSAWASPGSSCAGIRTRRGRSSSAPSRPGACRSSATHIARFILGGDTVGGATLSRFFAIHVFIIPACIFVFVGAPPAARAAPRHLRAARRRASRRSEDVPRRIRGAPQEGRRAVLARRGLARRRVRRRDDRSASSRSRSSSARPTLGTPPDPSDHRTRIRAPTGTSSGTSRCSRSSRRSSRRRHHPRRRSSSAALLFSVPLLSQQGRAERARGGRGRSRSSSSPS